MWIVLGGLTFLLSFGYFLYQRRTAAWSGDTWRPSQPVPGIRSGAAFYRKLTTGNKGGSIRLGLDCPEHFDFQIGPERGIDKFFKSVGLTHELQLQEPGFDDAVYVGCDDLYLIRLLKRSPAARDAIHGMMTRHRGGLMGRVTLHGRSGRVWLHASVKADVSEGDLSGLLAADAHDLLTLQQALVQLPTMLIEPVARRLRWQAATIATISAALASCAIVGWFAHAMASEKQLFFGQLLQDSLLLSAVLWALLVAATCVWLVKTARFHLVLLEVILFGSWGMFGSVSNVRLHVNMEHDKQPAIERCVSVIDKRISRSRRGGKSYYIELAGWQLSTGQHQHALEWKVSSSEYQSLAVGQNVQFKEHAGRLGYPWLSDLQSTCRIE